MKVVIPTEVPIGQEFAFAITGGPSSALTTITDATTGYTQTARLDQNGNLAGTAALTQPPGPHNIIVDIGSQQSKYVINAIGTATTPPRPSSSPPPYTFSGDVQSGSTAPLSTGTLPNNLLNDIAGVGSLFSGAILRDYTHASKTFRTNSYQYAPKLKFLFHTYFELNTSLGDQTNFGLLVKEIKLPTFGFQTAQMNQYNRKRIVQTKIKYEPIEISFHDDNGNQATKLWEAYYQYYYNDSTKTGSVLANNRGGAPVGQNDYNSRNIYNTSISGDDDWGFTGGQNTGNGVKAPFFKNITVFGFNQHNFTAYTLINPIITSFGHDTYNYAEGNGTMTNYGAMDGRSPGNIVTGFGDQAHYDTLPSPIAGQGQGTILGQGGLVDAAGGTLESLRKGDVVGAIAGASSVYNSVDQLTSPGNNINIGKEILNGLLRTASRNTPTTRNAMFDIPVAASSPGPAGLAGSPTVNAATSPIIIDKDAVQTGPNGEKYSYNTITGKIAAPPSLTQEFETLTTAGTQYSGDNLTAKFGAGFNIGPTNIA